MGLAWLCTTPAIAQDEAAEAPTSEVTTDATVGGDSEAPSEAEPEAASDADDEGLTSELEEAERAGGSLEEIVITATRRNESIQDVPISVSAISSDKILETGMTRFAEIQQFVPNLQILPATDTRSTSIRIRGIGSTGTNAGIDPSVGVFIDGVYQGRAGMSVGDLLDIQRIEVLRGPQGTLFGKNTAAGAISITTKRPQYDFETFAETKIGNYNLVEFRGSLNIPLLEERVAARFAGFKTLRDGFDINRFNGERVNDNNKYGVRGQLLWDITDELSVLLSGDFSEQNDTCCVSDIVTYEGTSLLGSNFDRLRREAFTGPPDTTNRFYRLDEFAIESELPYADPFDRVVGADVTPKNIVNVAGTALDAIWNPGDHRVRWLTAYRTYTSDSRFDGDFSSYDAIISWTDVDYYQVSSELIWTSPIWEKFEAQGGVYFFYSNMNTVDLLGVQPFYIKRNFTMNWGSGTVGIPSEGIQNTNDNTHEMLSAAAYAQGTYNFTEKWALTGGLRVTYEQKKRRVDSISSWKGGAAPVGGADIIDLNESREVTSPQGLIVLRYRPVDDVMIYGSFSNGFKSGGFNQVRVNNLPTEFGDELALNYELGTKTSWLDNRLQANITGFFTDYNDFQAQVFTGTSINVRNAGRLFSYGFESELVALPFDSLQLGLNVGFNVAEYDSFENAEATVEYQFAIADAYLNGAPMDYTGTAFICGADPLNQLPDPEIVDCSADLTGRVLDNAPRWTLSAFASHQYEIPNTEAIWFNRADWSYNSNYFLAQDLDPNLHQDGFHLLNLRTGFRADSGLWELTFWVDNVLDTGWAVAGFDVPVVGGFAVVNGPPRQYGGTVRFMF